MVLAPIEAIREPGRHILCSIESHILCEYVNAGLMPFDDTPLDIFFDFLKNSSGRFICMEDNDLTTKRPIRALLGRFRFYRNSTQAITLCYLRAFRAFLWL